VDALQGFVTAVSERCALVVEEPISDLPDVAPALETFLEPARVLLRGGKRMRAQLLALGWSAAGGPPGAAAVHAGAALELFQAAALVHDDIIDNADTRRGHPSTHIHFARRSPGDPAAHASAAYGTHAAILLGDLLLVLSHREMRRATAHAPDPVVVDEIWDRMTAEVAVGQYLDVRGGIEGCGGDGSVAAMDRSLQVIRHKSARYSVEHPLVLGGALAGASPALRDALTAIGLPLGEAFQLRDDDLGVFGDPARTGKPAGDDLIEGKCTPLVILGLEMSTPDDAAFLRQSLGDRSLGPEAIERIRGFLRASGAVSRHEELIEGRRAEALTAIDTAPIPEDIRTSLRRVADTLTRRDT